MLRRSVYIALVLIVIHKVLIVLGYDTSQSSWLDSQQNGYLYNLGAKKFVGTEGEDSQGRRWSYLVENPANATLFRVIGTVENSRVYNLITVINERARGPRSGQWSDKASLGMIDGHKYVGIDNRNDSKDHMFVFTAPAYMDTQAFRIFLDDYCMSYTGDKRWVIVMNCYSASNSRMKDQLWVWVNARRYEEDLRNNYFNYEGLGRRRDMHPNEGGYMGYYDRMGGGTESYYGGNPHGSMGYYDRIGGGPGSDYGRNPYGSQSPDSNNSRYYGQNEFCRNCLASGKPSPSSCPYCDNFD